MSTSSSMVGAGFAHTVAPLGTALTERQLQILWRMADEPILCFDGDKAGIRAAGRAADLALPLLAAGQEPPLRAPARGAGPRRPHPRRRPRGHGRGHRRRAAAGRHDLGARDRGAASSTRPSAAPRWKPGSARSPAAIGDESVRRHYVQAFAERVAAFFPAPRAAGSATGGGERRRGAGASGPTRPSATMPAPPIPVSDRLRRSGMLAGRAALAAPRGRAGDDDGQPPGADRRAISTSSPISSSATRTSTELRGAILDIVAARTTRRTPTRSRRDARRRRGFRALLAAARRPDRGRRATGRRRRRRR